MFLRAHVPGRPRRNGPRPARSGVPGVVAAVVAVAAAVAVVPSGQSGAEPDQADTAEIDGTAGTAVDAVWPEFDVAGARDVRRPGISGDGRWIVAEVELDDRSTAVRIDRITGRTVELTPSSPELRPGSTVHPVISDDGCVIAVVTELALDPFRDDDVGSRWDVYRFVVPECGGAVGRWELVSTDAAGTSRDDVDPTVPPAVAAAGGVIAFTHPVDAGPGPATSRSGSPTATTTTISVVDLTAPVGAPDRVEVVPAIPAEPPTGAYRYRGAFEPALSGDGRRLAFTADTTADEPLPGWGEGTEPGADATTQVFLWDRDDADRRTRITLVSARPDAEGSTSTSSSTSTSTSTASTGAWSPAVNADADVVVFVSADPDLTDTGRRVRCETECPLQVYRHELPASDTAPDDGDLDGDLGGSPVVGSLSAVSASPDRSGAALLGDADTWAPVIDRRGDRTVVLTRSASLSPGRVPLEAAAVELPEGVERGELLVVEGDRHPQRVSEAADIEGVPAIHGRAAISATGRVVVGEAFVGRFTGPVAPIGPVGSTTGRGLVAWVATPQVVLADLDFGTVLPGWEGDELYVSVRNDGPGSFAPATVSIGSPAFRVVPGGTCIRGAIVPAGGSCTVHVGFTPSSELDLAGVLTVAEDTAVPSDAVTVSAVVTGAGGEPTLRAEPGGIDLGEAAVGRVGERRAVDIRNISAVPTEVVAIELRGRDPGDFVVTAEACTGRALNPGATCAVEIEFVPSGPSLRTASLTAVTVDGAYTAAVIGGLARYEPELHLASPTVAPGERLGLGLLGFPPDADVRLSLDGGVTTFAVVRTDDAGGVLAEVLVPRRARGGHQLLSAQAGPLLVDELVTVVRPPDAPAGVPGYGLGSG